MFTFMEVMPIHIFKYRPRLDLDTLTLYTSMTSVMEYEFRIYMQSSAYTVTMACFGSLNFSVLNFVKMGPIFFSLSQIYLIFIHKLN